MAAHVGRLDAPVLIGVRRGIRLSRRHQEAGAALDAPQRACMAVSSLARIPATVAPVFQNCSPIRDPGRTRRSERTRQRIINAVTQTCGRRQSAPSHGGDC